MTYKIINTIVFLFMAVCASIVIGFLSAMIIGEWGRLVSSVLVLSMTFSIVEVLFKYWSAE